MFYTYTKNSIFYHCFIFPVKVFRRESRTLWIQELKAHGSAPNPQSLPLRTPGSGLRTLTYYTVLAFYLTGCSGTRDPLPDELPPVVMPGDAWFLPPPSDALVLFDGSGLDQWQRKNGKHATWQHDENYLEATPWKGSIWTRKAFGDMQLHVEWATPLPTKKRGQRRGNSGVKLMGLYEIQMLDSFENDTYPDGQAGAVYSQHAPLVNASKQPGDWQSYDIVFRRPRFRADGSLEQPAYVTVFHNGILVQNNVEITGPTRGKNRTYKPHSDRLPLMLQYHGSRVKFRNIWIRELE